MLKILFISKLMINVMRQTNNNRNNSKSYNIYIMAKFHIKGVLGFWGLRAVKSKAAPCP